MKVSLLDYKGNFLYGQGTLGSGYKGIGDFMGWTGKWNSLRDFHANQGSGLSLTTMAIKIKSPGKGLFIFMLAGLDSNQQPFGYKGPRIASRLGLYHVRPACADYGLRRFPPPDIGGSTPFRDSLCTFSELYEPQSLAQDRPDLLHRVSLNSPDFSTAVSRGSCNYGYSRMLHH